MTDRHSRVRALVDEHLGFVARTLRRAGVPPSEVDDEVQRTFIAVMRNGGAARTLTVAARGKKVQLAMPADGWATVVVSP